MSGALTWQGSVIMYHFDRMGQGAMSDYHPKCTKTARGQATKLDEATTMDMHSMRTPLSAFTITSQSQKCSGGYY